VIVIGGGAAGLMAAGQAAIVGAETLLLEKKPRPGLKLRITGKGRCNLTNDAPVTDFIERFRSDGRFLWQPFARFFAPDLIDFFADLGVSTERERGGRIFPADNDAGMIVQALDRWVRACGVTVRVRSAVTSLIIEKGRIKGVTARHRTKSGQERNLTHPADAVVIATGGASYPDTGSTGDGYRLAQAVGHTIVTPRPSLVPIEIVGGTAKRLQGLSLRNVNVSLWIDGRKRDELFGELLFTHFGLSGPTVLSLSRQIVDALESKSRIILSIDLKPALDEQKLDRRLIRDIEAHGRKKIGGLLNGLLPRKLISVCRQQTKIDSDKPGHQITSEERRRLATWLKDFRFEIGGHRGFNEAIITAGGVSVDEIDSRTMESRLVGGVFFAGEVIDIDADTGGYNLQAAFSTGWLAGQCAATK